MEVTSIGSRTRARAIAMRREDTSDRENSVAVKRRKLSNEKLKSHSSTTFVQTKTNDCDIYITSALEEEQSDYPTNACCSTRSVEELLKVSDLEAMHEESVEAETSARNNSDRIESGSVFITSKIQLKTESDKPDSDTTKPSLVKINASRHKVLLEEKIPPEAELEEFFATLQESLTKRFKDKYNYDIVNDIPLEGRFEWIQVKQGK